MRIPGETCPVFVQDREAPMDRPSLLALAGAGALAAAGLMLAFGRTGALIAGALAVAAAVRVLTPERGA
jgi:hypothetical protein